jgi:hypothetical protein
MPDELTATLSRVAVQVRQPFLDRFCAGQALPTTARILLPASNAQTDDQFRDPAVALLGMARIGTAAARN